MTSNMMSTEPGGEQTQYEAEHTDVQPHKKSGGQFGDVSTTTDPSKTDAQVQQNADRGERTAENIRYGQGISEGGMGGMTGQATGEANQQGSGQTPSSETSSATDGTSERAASGYGGDGDMDREVGA